MKSNRRAVPVLLVAGLVLWQGPAIAERMDKAEKRIEQLERRLDALDRPAATGAAGVAPTEDRAQEQQIPPVKWALATCMDVAQAVQFDKHRWLTRDYQNRQQGIVRAEDFRRVKALGACSIAAGDAGRAAGRGDDAEAERIMLGVYLVWNECRVALDLAEVAYGSIPDDARKQIDADRAKWKAERDSALEWSNEACKRIDAAVENDAKRLPPDSRDALRAFVGGWAVWTDNGISDGVVERDKEMRKLYRQWNSHRASLKLAAVPYGHLPDGTILAKPRASIGK